jgi:hypothetical protein
VESVQVKLQLGRSDEAERLKQTAISQLRCPAEPFERLLPAGVDAMVVGGGADHFVAVASRCDVTEQNNQQRCCFGTAFDFACICWGF